MYLIVSCKGGSFQGAWQRTAALDAEDAGHRALDNVQQLLCGSIPESTHSTARGLGGGLVRLGRSLYQVDRKRTYPSTALSNQCFTFAHPKLTNMSTSHRIRYQPEFISSNSQACSRVNVRCKHR